MLDFNTRKEGTAIPHRPMLHIGRCTLAATMEEEGEAIPAPSNLKDISTDADALVSLVCCDTIEYRKLYNNKAVKKTLTIPAWLNTMAERADLNFSDVLREALKLRLHIQ